MEKIREDSLSHPGFVMEAGSYFMVQANQKHNLAFSFSIFCRMFFCG